MPCGKRSSRQRPHDAVSSSRVPSVEREHPGPCRPLRAEPENDGQVAETDHDGRCADGPRGAEEHGADASRGSHRGNLSAEYTPAARRRARLPAGHHPQPQPQRPAPLTAASWHSRLPVSETAEKRKRFKTYEIDYVHIDSCELRHAGGKAGDVAGHRSGLGVHPCRIPRQRREDGGSRVPEECDRGLALQDPHRAHRQRHGLRGTTQEREGPSRRLLRPHIFDRVCIANRIEHRLTSLITRGPTAKPNGRTAPSRTLPSRPTTTTTWKASRHTSWPAYNFAKYLKALRWRTPY